jgi:hypothetical protein
VTVYLDASFVVSLFVTDVHTERADRWIADLKEEAIVSELCALEFAASVSRRVRNGADDNPGSARGADGLRRLARAFNLFVARRRGRRRARRYTCSRLRDQDCRSGRGASCGGNERSRKAGYLRFAAHNGGAIEERGGGRAGVARGGFAHARSTPDRQALLAMLAMRPSSRAYVRPDATNFRGRSSSPRFPPPTRSARRAPAVARWLRSSGASLKPPAPARERRRLARRRPDPRP